MTNKPDFISQLCASLTVGRLLCRHAYATLRQAGAAQHVRLGLDPIRAKAMQTNDRIRSDTNVLEVKSRNTLGV